MKNKFLEIILATSLAVLLLPAFTVSVSAAVRGNGPATSSVGTVALTSAEQDSLTLMREEEKLARDVYSHFYDLWQLPAFNYIAVSEQRHMDAIGNLMEKYGVSDPAVGNDRGVFTNTELQSLYDQLTGRGSESVEAALKVGVLIEETDIADLQAGLEETTHADIARVYSNLLNGSYNHLAAFNNELTLLASAA